MKHYKGYGPDWLPITVFLLGMLAAACAVSLILYHMVGVTIR